MTRTCIRLARFSLGALLVIATAGFPSTLSAGTLNFPADKPVFSVAFPDNWDARVEENGTLIARPNDNSGVLVTVLALEGINNEKSARSALARVADQIARTTELSGLKKGEIVGYKTEKNLLCLHQESKGRNRGGAEIVLTTIVFAPEEGQYFVLVTSATPTADKEHESELAGIVQSIDGE